MPARACNHSEPSARRQPDDSLSRALRVRIADALGGVSLGAGALGGLDDETLVSCLVLDRALTLQAIGAAVVGARHAAPRLVPTRYEPADADERVEVRGGDALPVVVADDFGRPDRLDEIADPALDALAERLLAARVDDMGRFFGEIARCLAPESSTRAAEIGERLCEAWLSDDLLRPAAFGAAVAAEIARAAIDRGGQIDTAALDDARAEMNKALAAERPFASGRFPRALARAILLLDRTPAAFPAAAPLPVERTPPADPDAKVVTQDGATWPKLRRAMTSREAQVARMVEDLEAIARERPGAVILDEDLMRKGWTVGQVRDHGRVARDRFREARAAAGRADEEARS